MSYFIFNHFILGWRNYYSWINFLQSLLSSPRSWESWIQWRGPGCPRSPPPGRWRGRPPPPSEPQPSCWQILVDILLYFLFEIKVVPLWPIIEIMGLSKRELSKYQQPLTSYSIKEHGIRHFVFSTTSSLTILPTLSNSLAYWDNRV